jgi:hypothetical protein
VSTILKALQRLEGEKGGEAEEGGLREGLVPLGEPLVRDEGARWRIAIIGVLAALVLGSFLWWMIPTDVFVQPTDSSLPAVATAPEPPSESSTRPERRPPPQRAAEAAEERPVAAATRASVSPPSREVAEPPPPVEKPASRVAVVEAPPPAVAEPPAAEPVAPPPPPPAKPKTPAPAVVATVRPPQVTVEKTIWHPVPERRLARIEVEGRKGALELHEGDAVGTLVVAEIQPSGVVFLHGGERIHRKVGARR